MAFVFGSQAKGTNTDESDVDVAVYLSPVDPSGIDIEIDREFASETEIWDDVERCLGREVDLVVLNRAPATLAAAVFYEGNPVVVKNDDVYWRFFLEITREAEDFRGFIREFRSIKSRSRSLSEVDRARLERILDFLDDELEDTELFAGLSSHRFHSDRSARRNVERWVENIVNATIDIAKIILASERRRLPQTYRETIEELGSVEQIDSDVTDVLSRFARLRNVLAHEYLDLRFTRIQRFLRFGPKTYAKLRGQIDAWISAREGPDG